MSNQASPNRGPEKPLTGVERKERKREDKDISDKSKEIAREVVESAESAELAEFVEGEVSEDEGKGKKKVSSGLPTAGQGTKARVARPIPDVSVMRIQIATRVKKEIQALKKEASKIKNSPNFSPFKFGQVIKRIRHLKNLLGDLAHETAENIKAMWIKYVQ